jgi:transcriptional regulator with XRE-family HTH domain
MEFEHLIYTRKAKGLSQESMAEKAGMEQTTYSRKERGLSPVTESEWERFAKILNVPVEQIKEERHNPKNENCNFYDHSVGIQYVNVPKELFDIMIKKLEKLL